jgi:DNA polymerase-3 subunit gamma/tau
MRINLIEDLQQYFGNKSLLYRVVVVENKQDNLDVERPLSKKEQYLKIIEEYPMVKVLKDRLKLELDY